jgi:hypothetical protein
MNTWKKYSIALAIRKIPIKITMKYGSGSKYGSNTRQERKQVTHILLVGIHNGGRTT